MYIYNQRIIIIFYIYYYFIYIIILYMNTDIVTENSILSAPMTATQGMGAGTGTGTGTGTGAGTSADSISWSTLLRYGLILLILAFLGLNIFTYLGKTTDFITDTFRPILAFFGYGIAATAKQTIDITAKGTKAIVNVAAGTATGGINVLENTLSGGGGSSSKINMPIPDDYSKAKSKSGFCYIGEDRGFRSCINVGEGDTCMSGDIFPTMDRCINPNLR
jgi:hypothetical protein